MSEPGDDDRRLCSARGCRRTAAWGLRWNNPRLHTPDRRKTWLACPDHHDALTEFLSLRGFLRESVPVGDLPENPADDENQVAGQNEAAGQNPADGADSAGRPRTSAETGR